MKIIRLAIIAAFLAVAAAPAQAWWGNNNNWGNNNYWGDWNPWPVWTPMYWADEMFDDNDSYGPGYWGGYSPYRYNGAPYYSGYNNNPYYGNYNGNYVYPGYGYAYGYPNIGYAQNNPIAPQTK